MSFLDRVLGRVPAWCAHLSAEQYRAFKARADEFARAIGLDPGAFDARTGEYAGVTRVSIAPYARQVRTGAASEIEEAFTRAKSAFDDSKRMEALLARVASGDATFEEVRPMLRVIVRDARALADQLAEIVHAPLAGALVEIVALDTPAALTFARREKLRALGVDDAGFLAEARGNTRRALVGSLPRGPVAMDVLEGIEQFGGDNASALLAVGGDEDPRACALWCVPARGNALRFLPKDGDSAIRAVPVMKHFATVLATQAREPLSGDVFARVHGALRTLRFGTIGTSTTVDIVDSEGDLEKLAHDAFPPA